MKRNNTHWDVTKREFYNNVKARHDEVQDVLDHAKECPGYVDFDTWYTQEYEWRFLNDVLGGQKKMGVAPFDYCNLIHLPKIKWTDSEDVEHIHTLIGTHTPAYYGFLAVGNLYSSDNSINISIVEPNSECVSEDERKIDIKVNSEVIGGKIDDVKVDGTSVVTDKVANIDLTGKQNNVIYQEDEPAEAAEGDLWAFKSEEKELDYNDLTNKPQINNVTLQNNISLSAIDVYDRKTIDEKISTGSATYRGSSVAGTDAPDPETYDYDTYIKSQLVGVTPGNNDYYYVKWSTKNLSDDCVYVSETGTWKFLIRLQGERDIKYVELYGAKGEVTQEQLDILKDSVENYIWLGESTENDDGLILHCIYYNPENSATYEAVRGDTNYTLTLDLSNKQYTVMTTQFAKKDELAEYTKTSKLVDIIYPIGAIYTSSVNVSPETTIGGTWTALGAHVIPKSSSISLSGSANVKCDTSVHTMGEVLKLQPTGTITDWDRSLICHNNSSKDYKVSSRVYESLGYIIGNNGDILYSNMYADLSNASATVTGTTVYMWKRIA